MLILPDKRLDFTCLRVALVLHWPTIQRHRLLWCFTGYHFIDEELCQPKRHCSGALLATISVAAGSLVLHSLLFHGRRTSCAALNGIALVLCWLQSQ